MLSVIELEQWLADPASEKAIIYHVGHLARDRLQHMMVDGKLYEATHEPLHSIAALLYEWSEEGKVLLYQKRVDVGAWEYWAMRRKR